MEPIYTPKMTVSFTVDLDLKYDSYQGRTQTEIAVALQDALQDLLFEASPQVIAACTSITNIKSHD